MCLVHCVLYLLCSFLPLFTLSFLTSAGLLPNSKKVMSPSSQSIFCYSGTHNCSCINKNRVQLCPCFGSFHGVFYFCSKVKGNIWYHPSLNVDIINMLCCVLPGTGSPDLPILRKSGNSLIVLSFRSRTCRHLFLNSTIECLLDIRFKKIDRPLIFFQGN